MKLLVMTNEKCTELREFFNRNRQGAAYDRVRAALAEVDLDDMDFECGWGMKKCSGYLRARVKG